ncbi:MAG: DUF362 domain-containing protein [Chlorobium sp.]|nr:DUF362 domain-containing protein [Chlorobium sp.]
MSTFNDNNKVKVLRIGSYDEQAIYDALPDSVFTQVQPGDTVILKPNWVMESHVDHPDEWEHVITHPTVITAVLRKVIDRLAGGGRVVITDGPQTDASFAKLIAHYPVDIWHRVAESRGVALDVIDLRDNEWKMKDGIVVERLELPGDPCGKTEVVLNGEESEFWKHRKSKRGYYGADYNRTETNLAHDGQVNRYSVSRTVLEADVFINLPKLKTHRKSGITCCLKNLVGINTYKNYLPHHSEGGPCEGGDQFPVDNVNARIEGPLMAFLKKHVLTNPLLARLLSPLNSVGKKIFGDTSFVIRSGNWYGNDTIWRMILDLNKVLFFANSDGTMRDGMLINAKRYIGIVDAIIAGEGHGPLAPDPVEMGYLFCGTNPVAIDAVSATFMGFDPLKISTIANAFQLQHYPLCDFGLADVLVSIADKDYLLSDVPLNSIVACKPQFGWKGHIEREL